jgi:hypothetical protein
MAAVRSASGSPAVEGRFPQCRQGVSAATCSRARDSTAVKDTAEAGPGGGCRRRGQGRDHVVDEEQCPGFLADERLRASAQDAAGAADGPFECKNAISTCHLSA